MLGELVFWILVASALVMIVSLGLIWIGCLVIKQGLKWFHKVHDND